MKKTNEKKDIAIGDRIRDARINAGLSQAELAERFEEPVSYQSVSLWERGSLPTIDNLVELAGILGVSVSSLVEDRDQSLNKTTMAIFDHNHMFTFLKGALQGMPNALKALNNIKVYHEGQYRKINFQSKKSQIIPYVYHPLSLACNLFALGVKEDEIIAAALLHDVLEDCVMVEETEEIRSIKWVEKYNEENKDQYTVRKLKAEDLKIVDKNVQRLVSLLTRTCEKNDEKGMNKYYAAIAKDPKASLIKCVDRLNNLSTMSWGLSRERMYNQILETEKYYPKLLKATKDTPEYNSPSWLCTYSIYTMLDIYKRLM